ncbi:PadR family transcriptional regulator [Streptomyces malaysiensis]|uniref:PadR family transcriptional regulator n=1 Tax=Streptomyces malaysiensis subsp. samsunensis TaxID=459658 RepID=A0A9X2M6P2_STRMQ|nr:PadR family transcriptional regulator [Streptomyces samsunensis]MCQ8836433.1 PadR family transcriptional regulator [Streptomyces samsunensis]
MTLATRAVVTALLARPTDEHYGLEIADAAGLPGGTIYPILIRLERLGWLESRWEDIDPQKEGRPPRRYYRFSEAGAQSATAALNKVDTNRQRRSSFRPQEGSA